jgi:hypothetical protein
MARRIDLATAGGMLCACVALLLLWSGVPPVEAEDTANASTQAAAAAPAPLLPPADGPSCRVDATQDSSRAEALADVNARLAADAEAAAHDPDFVVLNNRGYNYGANSVTDPQLLKFEAGTTQP